MIKQRLYTDRWHELFSFGLNSLASRLMISTISYATSNTDVSGCCFDEFHFIGVTFYFMFSEVKIKDNYSNWVEVFETAQKIICLSTDKMNFDIHINNPHTSLIYSTSVLHIWSLWSRCDVKVNMVSHSIFDTTRSNYFLPKFYLSAMISIHLLIFFRACVRFCSSLFYWSLSSLIKMTVHLVNARAVLVQDVNLLMLEMPMFQHVWTALYPFVEVNSIHNAFYSIV